MKNTYRVLGLVACLFVVWMVTTAGDGCGIVTHEATITLEGKRVPHGQADVYGGGTASAAYHTGKLGTLTVAGTGNAADPATGTFKIVWYDVDVTSVHEGILTVLCKTWNEEKGIWEYNGEHRHVPFSVTDTVSVTPPPSPVPVHIP